MPHMRYKPSAVEPMGAANIVDLSGPPKKRPPALAKQKSRSRFVGTTLTNLVGSPKQALPALVPGVTAEDEAGARAAAISFEVLFPT